VLNRKHLLNLLKITVSLVLVVVILRSVDVTVLWQVIRHANPWYLVGALAASMAGVVLRAYRWQILVNDQGVTASLGELTALWFVSFLFTNILPSGIGGDAVRAYELSRSSERGAQAVTSVLVDRFVGLFALQTIALVALAFSWRLMPDQLVFITVLLFSISLLAAAVLAFPPLWNAAEKWIPFFDRLLSIKFIRSLVDSLQSYTHSALLRAFVVGLVFNILLITITVLVARGLGDTLPLPYYMIFVPIASIVILVPISFAGLGVREGTYVFLFSLVGVSREMALSISLLIYAVGTVAPGIVGGVIYIVRNVRGTRRYGMPKDIP
jgi:uncharacterized protein (TIRG00374 family)